MSNKIWIGAGVVLFLLASRRPQSLAAREAEKNHNGTDFSDDLWTRLHGGDLGLDGGVTKSRADDLGISDAFGAGAGDMATLLKYPAWLQ